MGFKDKFVKKILSEDVYSGLMVYPAMLIAPTMFMLIILQVLSFMLMVFFVVGYIVYMVGLKYLKIIYQEKYKIYLYLFSIVYDVDFRKPSVGWIVIDSTETYPIELGIKDEILAEKKQIKKELSNLLQKKKNLSRLLISPIEMIKNNLLTEEQSKDKKDKKKEKEIAKFSEEREKEIKKAIDKIDEQIKNLNIKLNKVKDFEKQSDELRELQNSQRASLNLNRRDPSKPITEIKLDQESYNLPEFTFFRARIVDSDIYSNNKELIFLLPTDSIFNCFIFTDDYGYFANMQLEVPNYAVATFLEGGVFKKMPYLICTYSSYYVKKGGLIQMKKEIAEALMLNAKLSYFADEVSQIKHEYETLIYDNMDLEKHNSTLSDELKKISKRGKEVSEMKRELSKFSFKGVKKEYQMITIMLAIVVIFLLVLLLLVWIYPEIFGLYRPIVEEPSNGDSNNNETSSLINSIITICRLLIN